jgi:hypothetical protein
MLTTRPSKLQDAVELAPHLRPEDLAEINANTGRTAVDTLSNGYLLSEPCFSVVNEEGTVVAMFGAVPVSDSPGVGLVWLLASPELVRRGRQFLRESKAWIEKLHQTYPILWNFVDSRNTTHIRWLKWIGVNFVAEHPEYGVAKIPFKEFIHV